MPLKAVQRARASAEQIVFPNLSQIVALPCKEETIRGYSSVGLLIIDEAARVPDELYQAVRPMLAASDGRLICLSTPYGRVGFFHDAWTSDTQDWERISVRAADVPHIKPEFLARERQIMLPATYAQEYNCEFTILEGLVYPEFLARTECPLLCETGTGPERTGGRLVGGIDFGFRNPFAAVWGGYDPVSGVLTLTGERYQRGVPLSEHLSYLPRRVKWFCDPAGANERAEMSAAAGRMWAARNLAERGPEAKAAVPALRQATSDPEPHVRAWAHTALAFIEGNVAEHRRAIREILKNFIIDKKAAEDEQQERKLDRSFAQDALDELQRPADERALNRLTGAAITNDVETIRSMLKIVDVNRVDHNNSTALSYAVGNGHMEAARALLEAGANPNQLSWSQDRSESQTLLHEAAPQRKGAALIRFLFEYGADPNQASFCGDAEDGTVLHDAARESAALTQLLLEYGADPWRKNEEGKTPLDVAREDGRKKAGHLLEEAMRRGRDGRKRGRE